MKFDDPAIREQIRNAPHPDKAAKFASPTDETPSPHRVGTT